MMPNTFSSLIPEDAAGNDRSAFLQTSWIEVVGFYLNTCLFNKQYSSDPMSTIAGWGGERSR